MWFSEYCNWEINLTDNTLVLLGSEDHLFSADRIYDYLKKHHPNVTIKVFAGDYPGASLEASDRYIDEIVPFFESVM